jgi:DNA-binding IclR family transcriptional regulator
LRLVFINENFAYVKLKLIMSVLKRKDSTLANGSADKYRAPALDKGLDILELLAASPTGLTQAEIAKGLGRAINEIYRMLDTLVRRHYISRSRQGDKYMLSLKLLVLANAHPPRRRLLDIAEPTMREISMKTEQSCHLATWEEGDIIIASAFSAPGNWRLSLRPGSLVGVYNTGSGQVIMAFQKPEQQKQMLLEHQLVKGEEPVEPEEYQHILAKIRSAGFAREPSQTTVGVVNLSFPILDPSGNAIACLTCPFLQRIDDYEAPSLDQTTEMFEIAATEISQQISGFGEVSQL